MGEAARVFGTGFSFHDGDTLWNVSPFVMGMFGLMENWLEELNLNRIERKKGLIADDVYRDRLDAQMRLIGAMEYTWTGAAFWTAMRTMDGLRERFFLQLAKGSPGKGVSRDLANDLFDRHQDLILRHLAKDFENPSGGTATNGETPSPSGASSPASSSSSPESASSGASAWGK